jgi:integrase
MPEKRLHPKTIGDLPALKNAQGVPVRTSYQDTVQPGLVLRVTPSGARSFVVNYRYGKKWRRLTIGRWPKVTIGTARKAAKAALSEIAMGNDPAGDKIAKRAKASGLPVTVEELVESFLKLYAEPNQRSAHETRRFLTKEVVGRWKGRPFAEIRKADIHAALDEIMAAGHGRKANRFLAYTRKLFAWAVERDLLEASPVAGVKKPAKEKARDRILEPEELATLWATCEGLGAPFGPTGQRRTEVAQMAWDELTLEGGEPAWRIPAEKTKSGREHVVPLSPQAVAILKKQIRVEDCPWVFSSWVRGRVPISGFSKWKAQLDRECQIAAWTLHDLRRTMTSELAKLGAAPHILSACLNHSQAVSGVLRIYNRHNYEPEMRRALCAWANRLEAITEGRTDNVIPLHGA